MTRSVRRVFCLVGLSGLVSFAYISKAHHERDSACSARRAHDKDSDGRRSFLQPLCARVIEEEPPTVPSPKWNYNWDRREPSTLVKKKSDNFEEEVKKHKPTAIRHLFLIRHGQYFVDAPTDEARVLTALGRQQAELTGRRLKELNHPYSRLVHSTMARAIETADIINSFIKLPTKESDDLLREGSPIAPDPPIDWKPDHVFFCDGSRIEAAFRRYFHRADVSQKEDSYEVIVCHGNVIRYFVCRALQFQPEAWLRMSLYHASITHMSIRPSGRVVLYTLGDSGHLPQNAVTKT